MIRLRLTLTFAIIFTMMRLTLVAQQLPAQPAWEINALTDEGGAVYDFQTGITTATNGVIIKRGNSVMTANGVTVYHQTGEAVASGNVRIEQGDQLWVGDEMRYNFNTRQMEARQFRTGMPPVFMQGNNLHADIKGNAYGATNGFFTTDDVPNPGHRLRARKIRVIPGQSVEAWGATLYLGKVPVFYFPYYKRNLGEHANNFNFTPGYRSSDGAFLLTSYVWFWNDMVDGALNADYRTQHGVGLGPDLNLHLGQWGNASLRYYYLNDTSPGGTNIPPDRHRLLLTYLAEPYTNLTIRSVLRYESDMRVLRDFFESEYRSDPQQATFLEVNKLWENFSLDGYVQPRINEFNETVERLPEVKLTAFRQKIGPLPLYYESESSAGFYRRLFADTNGPVMPSYDAMRLDSFQQVTAPIMLFGWLNLTPRIGGRFSYYGAVSNPAGTNSAGTRFVFNTGVELSFKASRTMPEVQSTAFDLDGLRHIIEPSVNYAFVPTPNRRLGQVPQFDSELPSLRLLPLDFPDYNSIDSIDSMNVVRFGLRNRFQTKRLGRVVDFIDWQLFADVRLTPQHGQKTLSDLFSDFTIHPRDWFAVESFTRFDLNTGQLRLAFHTVTLQPSDTWSWSFGHYYLQSNNSSSPTALGPGNNLFSSTLFYRPTENWSFTAIHRFDARTGSLEEQEYDVYRDFRSWTGSMAFRVRQNQGGSEDYTVAFTFSFKANPRSGPSPVQNMQIY